MGQRNIQAKQTGDYKLADQILARRLTNIQQSFGARSISPRKGQTNGGFSSQNDGFPAVFGDY